MSSRAPYSAAYDPPAPVVPVRIAAPFGGRGVGVLGVVDTGADLTVVPEAAAESLDLPVVSRVRVVGVTGAGEAALVRAASVELAGSSFLLEVACLGNETILGRDLLNRLVLRLDGPARSLEIVTRKSTRRKKSRSPRSR